MIMWMFGNSEDEYRCVGPADVGSGFKWFLNDADGYLRSAGNRTGFASNAPGVFGRSAGDGTGSLFSLLFKAGNPEFRMLLADRIHKHYFNDGAMTPAKTVARLQERCEEMDSPFRSEAIRWNYRTHASWTSRKEQRPHQHPTRPHRQRPQQFPRRRVLPIHHRTGFQPAWRRCPAWLQPDPLRWRWHDVFYHRW